MKEQAVILSASNNPDCLDSIGLYTIMLAQRTGMKACLLFVHQDHKCESSSNQDEIKNTVLEKTSRIQSAGTKANVEIDRLITSGQFSEEVAKYLHEFDSSILIVGEGDCRVMRKRELRKVKEILRSKSELCRGRLHHFLMISAKKGHGQAKNQAISDSISINQFYQDHQINNWEHGRTSNHASL